MGYLSDFLRSRYASEEAPQQQASASASNPPSTQPDASTSGSAPVRQVVASNTAQTPSTSVASTASSELDARNLYRNPRARTVKQLSIYFGGATFFAASVLITRRAVTRKLVSIIPKFYTPSNFRPTDANGAVEAAEAFALATINVTSLAIMLTGGSMFALDVVNAEDLRAKYMRRMGFTDNWEQGADEEIEEWVKEVLGKKESGDYKGVAEGLTALVGMLAGKEEDKERLASTMAEKEATSGGDSKEEGK